MVCVCTKFHIGPVIHDCYMILHPSKNYLNGSCVFFKDHIRYMLSVTKVKWHWCCYLPHKPEFFLLLLTARNKNHIDMVFYDITFIPNVVKIYKSVQNFELGHTHMHTQWSCHKSNFVLKERKLSRKRWFARGKIVYSTCALCVFVCLCVHVFINGLSLIYYWQL
jgi:hypothetical protein